MVEPNGRMFIGFPSGKLQRLAGTWSKWQRGSRWAGRPNRNQPLHFGTDRFTAHSIALEHLRQTPACRLEHSQQHMLGADKIMAQCLGLITSQF
jgi:hypothetical protein